MSGEHSPDADLQLDTPSGTPVSTSYSSVASQHVRKFKSDQNEFGFKYLDQEATDEMRRIWRIREGGAGRVTGPCTRCQEGFYHGTQSGPYKDFLQGSGGQVYGCTQCDGTGECKITPDIRTAPPIQDRDETDSDTTASSRSTNATVENTLSPREYYTNIFRQQYNTVAKVRWHCQRVRDHPTLRRSLEGNFRRILKRFLKKRQTDEKLKKIDITTDQLPTSESTNRSLNELPLFSATAASPSLENFMLYVLNQLVANDLATNDIVDGRYVGASAP